jgi:hypothetical protein
MIYFVDDNKWDIDGYYDNLKKISKKLGASYEFLLNTSLHDFRISKLELSENNLEISSNIFILNPYDARFFKLTWHYVSDYQVSYKATDYRYADSEKIVTDDGYGTISEDEITEYDSRFLKHEILLTSKMHIVIIAETIEIQQLNI